MDDNGNAPNNATDITRKKREVFKCIRQAGLKLTIEKCLFGVRQVDSLGGKISAERISPKPQIVHNFLDKPSFPKSIKGLQQYLGFVNYYRTYFTTKPEKLDPFYKLLEIEVPINITSEFKENKALSGPREVSLEQSIPGKHLVQDDGCQLQKRWTCPHG